MKLYICVHVNMFVNKMIFLIFCLMIVLKTFRREKYHHPFLCDISPENLHGLRVIKLIWKSSFLKVTIISEYLTK